MVKSIVLIKEQVDWEYIQRCLQAMFIKFENYMGPIEIKCQQKNLE